MTTWAILNFLDASSPVIEQISCFHDYTIIILVIILTSVGYCIIVLVLTPYSDKTTMENQPLETFWTVLPALILVFIALPSLKILYLTDESNNPELTLKVVGHQWYWSYEMPEFEIRFSAYIASPDLEESFRLLDVDSRVAIPISTPVRVLVTSSDVIHSWTIQPLGVKIDAVPGRLNQCSIISKIPGVLYGQCSEICGANHRFMPISIEFIPINVFKIWALKIAGLE